MHSSMRIKRRQKAAATLSHRAAAALESEPSLYYYSDEMLRIALWGVHACEVQIFYVGLIWPGGKFLVPLYLTLVSQQANKIPPGFNSLSNDHPKLAGSLSFFFFLFFYNTLELSRGILLD